MNNTTSKYQVNIENESYRSTISGLKLKMYDEKPWTVQNWAYGGPCWDRSVTLEKAMSYATAYAESDITVDHLTKTVGARFPYNL